MHETALCAECPAGGSGPVWCSRRTDRNNAPVPLNRIAWLVTVLACLLTAVLLLISGYQGYAAVAAAVGASAAINLL
jgi:hypothetical protein